jgi:hypothetical protein
LLADGQAVAEQRLGIAERICLEQQLAELG